MFRLFSPCVINLSRNKNICCGWKKCSALIGWFAWFGSNMGAFAAWQVVSSMKNEQQSQNLLLKVDQPSTFRNTFFQPATNVFLAGQVDHARWKTRNIDPKLSTKQYCATSWGFLYLVFRCLYSKQFWNDLEIYWCSISSKRIRLSLQNVLVGIIAENTDPLDLLLNYFIMIGKPFCGIAQITKFFPTFMDFEQKLLQNMKLKK